MHQFIFHLEEIQCELLEFSEWYEKNIKQSVKGISRKI